MENKKIINDGKNFTVCEMGKRLEWPDRVELPGKQFLKDHLGLTGCEISINSLKPGTGMSFYHKHQQNEEVYLFVQGKGQMQVDGEVIEVQEGTMVRIAPSGVRTWRNNSDEPLLFIVIQVRENSLKQWLASDGVVSKEAVLWPHSKA